MHIVNKFAIVCVTVLNSLTASSEVVGRCNYVLQHVARHTVQGFI